ncbi:MAG: GAF domain-containing protein [Chloroflexi bacterium AL-W]|nr:GAF domain-containing protein [Chloroflexi bacterium AL-N1]NOK68666.1 GAF domain-containing protein [Chloroflexi bacterium AL-N10]NOK76152.1 GAF domain-containing protein [Chloroflexi bacterium AL-N5]NOK84211.1 GAF domain-containing protein [Chloroflexi bacterium AL-W]NOK91290.1 GAF domain-containing protein [Chloroflexi bacterium AL-N15]
MSEQTHILVVDDDPSIRRMLSLLLNDTGYRVSTATNGAEALSFMDLVIPDLVLMDLMMPDIDGQEVTRRIKSNPKYPFIPIILITARSDQRSKVAGLDAGADDFLVKPVEFAELLARVRAMLRLQRSQRSLEAEKRKTELLLHLTRQLGTTLDMDKLLNHFLERLADAVGAMRASIILTVEDTVRCYSSNQEYHTIALKEIVQQGVAGWVLRSCQPTIVADTREDTRWLSTNEVHETVRSVAAAPILWEGKAIGTITLVHHTPGHFTNGHLELLISVAAQSAIALENAELFRLTRSQKDLLERRAEELQRINQVSQHLTELMSPDQLLRLVAHLTHHTFGYEMVSILLYNGEGLTIRAESGHYGDTAHVGLRLPPERGITWQVITTQEPLNVPDVQHHACYLSLGGDEWVRSELAVPILTAREVFGVLDVKSSQQAAFGANDIRLLDTLARQLGVALDNAQLFDTEKRRVSQLDDVNNLSVAITANLNPAENLRIAADAVAHIFGVSHCGIILYEHEGQNGSWAISSNSPQTINTHHIDELLNAPHITSHLNLTEPCIIQNLTDDERLQRFAPLFEQGKFEALAFAPLFTQGRRIGLITLDITEQTVLFGPSELKLLETVASLIAQVMENVHLYRQVTDERSTLNAVLDGAADPILLISPEEQLLLANRAAEQQFGINGTKHQAITSLIKQPDLVRALSQSNGHAPILPNEVTIDNKTTFSVSVAPVKSATNEPLGRVAVMQDITAIKELERQEQERLRSVLRRYVSPPVVERMLAGGTDFGKPVERNVAVIFADLRGYTSLTEGMDAHVLVEQVLNRYFTAMTEVFYRYEGTIDKFLGDGIIGVFGTPIMHEDNLQRALAAAVDLQLAFANLHKLWEKELGLSIGMGVGVGYGPAVVGDIGSPQRLDYTLIGDVVNTASRLSSIAQAGQVIVSYHLIDALPLHWTSPWPLYAVGRVPLKGKQEPHLIYEVQYKNVAIVAK